MADIETILLQTKEIHKIQISKDIYSISEELRNIIHRDIEQQAHYIQVLLANKLDQYKENKTKVINKYIKALQKAYQEIYYISQEISWEKQKQKSVSL